MTARRSSLILIADGFTDPDRRKQVISAVKAGAPWVHLRDHDADDATFRAEAKTLVQEIRALGGEVQISSNQRLETAEALGLGYHGGRHGPGVEVARERLGPEAVIGWSAHALEEVQRMSPEVVDYVFYSPIFPTSSKLGHSGVGLNALADVCATSPVPVYALGGITPERVAACHAAGARGVAVLSGIMDAPDPAKEVEKYLGPGF